MVRRRAALRSALRLALTAAGCALSGCGGERDPAYFGRLDRGDKDATTLYANSGTEPEYLDPGKANDTTSVGLIQQMFEGLTSYHPSDLHPVQGVATHWDQSADGLRYRFHLRPEARWSDGLPVRAQDFEYAWKRVLGPSFASTAANNLFPLKNAELFQTGRLKSTRGEVTLRSTEAPGGAIVATLPQATAVRVLSTSPAGVARVTPHTPGAAPPVEGFLEAAQLVSDPSVLGVRAIDDLTLDVVLERPTPYFTELTSVPTLSPVRRDVIERFEQRGEPELWVRPENIIVNGPYTLESWRFRDSITMKRQPHYWAGQDIRIERIVWLEISDVHPAMNLYRAAEIDTIGSNVNLPAEYTPVLADKKDFHRYPHIATYWYEFNTRLPPFDDARVRHALNLAIDKHQLVDKIARGGQIAATHYVPDFAGGGYAQAVAADRAASVDPFLAPEVSFDPARARALLTEAGFEIVEHEGERRARNFPAVELLYNTNELHRQMAVAVQDMWKTHLGISISLRNEEWRVMLKNLRDGHFQIARAGWVGNFNHPQAWLDTFVGHNPQNRTGWSDAEFERLLTVASNTADPQLSVQRYRAAEQRAVQGMARLPVYFHAKSTLVKPWVKGFVGNVRSMHLVKWLWIDPAWRTSGDNRFAVPFLELPQPGRLDAAP